MYPSIYKGVVTQTADPEGLGRLKAQVPQLFGPQETDWAWPAQPNIRSIVSLEPGDPVWIMFESGDPAHPVWLGTWLKTGATPPLLPVPPPPPSDETLVWMVVNP